MSEDKIYRVLNSSIQHGHHNNRIYLMKLNKKDCPAIIHKMNNIAKEYGYSKSFAKIPERFKDEFLSDGYICEGVVPGMFLGKEDGYFLSKYYDEKRKINKNCIITDKILAEIKPDSAKDKIYTNNKSSKKLPREILQRNYCIRQADYSDCDSLAGMFSKTFESYPFPVGDPSYIRKTMDEGIVYFGIWKKDILVAASSSETDEDSKSVEMTDFATHKDFQGKGLAGVLLDKMEGEMKNRGFLTAYTISRASFMPVNLLFYRRFYSYCGTLINNTNICGSFESMNLWYKKL